MQFRQAGVEQVKVRASFTDYPRSFKIYKAEILISRIINDAYKIPVHQSPHEKLTAIYEFDNSWFEMCLSRKFKTKEVTK